MTKCFLNGSSPASFCLFSSFQTNVTILTKNKCLKFASSIRYCDQCDQIGLLFKGFVTNSSNQVAQTLSDVLGYFKNHLFLNKNSYGYYLAKFWGNLGYFLFYHLVLLTGIELTTFGTWVSSHNHSFPKWTNCWTIFYYIFKKLGLSWPLIPLFSSFRQLTVNMFILKSCRWLDSNLRPLGLEATTLPTEPQPVPIYKTSSYPS